MSERSTTPDATALQWACITVDGAQSETYLQGQLSQDLSSLGPTGSWALLLEPDGTVLTSCFVEGGGEHFALTVPRDLGDAALARLRRFHLRVNCTLELRDAANGPFDDERSMIDAGWPSSREFATPLTPQSFGATFVRTTVSFTKGCFTGQELVGRLDARGSSVPWRLVRGEGPNAARLDEVLRSKGPDGPKGVTTVVTTTTGVRALGLAHRTVLEPSFLETLSDVTIDAVA